MCKIISGAQIFSPVGKKLENVATVYEIIACKICLRVPQIIDFFFNNILNNRHLFEQLTINVKNILVYYARNIGSYSYFTSYN